MHEEQTSCIQEQKHREFLNGLFIKKHKTNVWCCVLIQVETV